MTSCLVINSERVPVRLTDDIYLYPLYLRIISNVLYTYALKSRGSAEVSCAKHNTKQEVGFLPPCLFKRRGRGEGEECDSERARGLFFF